MRSKKKKEIKTIKQLEINEQQKTTLVRVMEMTAGPSVRTEESLVSQQHCD